VTLLAATRGTGKEMRHAMGLAVFAGMLGVTLFGLFLTPVFFVTSETLFSKDVSPPRRETQRYRLSVELATAAGEHEDVPALFATEQTARERSAKVRV
jgi:hypothetical protein